MASTWSVWRAGDAAAFELARDVMNQSFARAIQAQRAGQAQPSEVAALRAALSTVDGFDRAAVDDVTDEHASRTQAGGAE